MTSSHGKLSAMTFSTLQGMTSNLVYPGSITSHGGCTVTVTLTLHPANLQYCSQPLAHWFDPIRSRCDADINVTLWEWEYDNYGVFVRGCYN